MFLIYSLITTNNAPSKSSFTEMLFAVLNRPCVSDDLAMISAGLTGIKSKKISNDQEPIQSDPTSCLKYFWYKSNVALDKRNIPP